MARPALNAELRDYASFLVDRYRSSALAKVDERIATLCTRDRHGMIADWVAIGEEIAALLRTDSSLPH